MHAGFKKTYLSIHSKLIRTLKNNTLPIFITGHSLDAALATLATSELCKNEYFDSCYTYGSPKTGNPKFIDSINSDCIYRMINNCGLVTTVPTNVFFNRYKHIGQPYLLEGTGSLVTDVDDEGITKYQRTKLKELEQYTKSKFLLARLVSSIEVRKSNFRKQKFML